jgi:hypothetical protein
VIRWHLSGQDDQGRAFVMGVYPMLLDETCFFLAADFDKAAWQDDAAAFLETCRQMNVPGALERSRSDNGGALIGDKTVLPMRMEQGAGKPRLTCGRGIFIGRRASNVGPNANTNLRQRVDWGRWLGLFAFGLSQ